MKKKIILLLLLVATIAISVAALTACVQFEEGPIPGLNINAVMEIEHNRLNFALKMDVDSPDIISRCGCILTDAQGNSVRVTKEHLVSGKVQYTPFDVSTVGSNRQVTVTYNDVNYYIFYDVDDYSVDFYLGNDLHSTVKPEASFSSDMKLVCGIDMNDNNYATEADTIANNSEQGLRFCGWQDSEGNQITGVMALQPPTEGNERKVKLYAKFLSNTEYSRLNLGYDSNGEKVFLGYKGPSTETVVIPESVTYIDLDIFANESGYKYVSIPSSARLSLPLQKAVEANSIEGFIVDEHHPRYSSFAGGIYNKSLSVLYYYPSGAQNLTMSENTVQIAAYAMAGSSVKNVSLPANVNVLSHYCFKGSMLETLAGWNHVASVMTGAFDDTEFAKRISVEEDGAMYYSTTNDEGETCYVLTSVKDDVKATLETFKVKDGTVSISGDAFHGCKKLTEVELPETLKSIGESAFVDCTSLKKINIEHVEEMGSSVFKNCTSLEKITIPDLSFVMSSGTYKHMIPRKMFSGCTSLSSVTVDENITYIGSESFLECSSLSAFDFKKLTKLATIESRAFKSTGLLTIELPETVKTLGLEAFSRTKIKGIDLSACTKLTTLPSGCFSYSTIEKFTFPEQIKTAPNQLFAACQQLTTVDLGNVEVIEKQAFHTCTKLANITWSPKLKTIAENSFNKSVMTSIVLPDTVESVGAFAFRNCAKLQSIHFGPNVSAIGYTEYDSKTKVFGTVSPAFYECAALKTITVDPANPYFTSIDGVLYGKSLGGKEYEEGNILYFVPCNWQNTTLDLPSTVKIVCPYSIYNQKKLTTVNINEGCEVIGKATFYQSALLKDVTISSTVNYIGASVFLNCTSIQSAKVHPDNQWYSSDEGGHLITSGSVLNMIIGTPTEAVIQEGTTEIADAVFMTMPTITKIEIADSVTKIGVKAFQGCTGATTLKIGKGLAEFDSTTFSKLSSLQYITVDGGNTNYKVLNGMLFDFKCEKLYLVPARNGITSLELSEKVTEICDWAVSYHATLKTLRTPNNLVKIGENAFYECRALESFVANHGLKSIGKQAFSFEIPAGSAEDTRCCNTLKSVLLCAGVESIGENAFYGQYGIEYLYFDVLNVNEALDIINLGSRNLIYLTKGCPNNSGEGDAYWNKVKRCIYSATKPTIPLDDYYYWHWDDNEQPVLWPQIGQTEV